jgi:hypothetical protein
LTAACVPEPLTRAQPVTVVVTKITAVPEELTEEGQWPAYPIGRSLNYDEAPGLAEEYKQLWMSCEADKDRIRMLPGEAE